MTASAANVQVTQPRAAAALRDAPLLAVVDRVTERLGEGSLVIDADGAVLQANRVARRIIRERDGIGMFNNRLAFADATASTRYRHAIGSLRPGGTGRWEKAVHNFCVRRPSGKRPFLLSVQHTAVWLEHDAPWSPATAIALIRDPHRRSKLNTALLAQSYDLSPAELELAAALDGGATLREIAGGRRVSITTVRSQLYALMAKLDVNRQTDLVRLFANYRQQ